MTQQQALDIGTKAIGQHDARLLLSHITGQSLTNIILNNTKPLDEPAIGAFLAAIERRKAKEPLQYILGRWAFMGLDIITDPRALIPRQETELLVEEALAFIHGLGRRRAKVLDVCTGSGCIAVAIAKLSDADVTAIDISPAALALAAENTALHQADIHFLQSDLFAGLDGQAYDVIISNPPYIPTGELTNLQTEIQDHEPMLALDGGPDGIDIYRRLIPASLNHLTPDGALFLEIGPRVVETIMKSAGYGIVRLVKDYAGLNRVLAGQKQHKSAHSKSKRSPRQAKPEGAGAPDPEEA